MEKLKKMLPYLAANILPFYILPLISSNQNHLVMLLTLIFPMLTIAEAFVCGSKYGFNILYPITVGVLFVPTAFLFYDDSALSYALIYGGLALLSSYISSKIIKK
ncbi:hypothetical protein JYG23_03975 [Sedimentibacter sp. zth1]|uniref:hypothetical protein n=1 Tax=Sedimentibacter sp. zth1 TaxID=2816908 RepID=UPI001A93154F|nr:hypothetical protein [Sedimentibacter sp. zth1]QSX06624.1 hypothetical protein JYG23_03975 [Sedimentibacter sp. zth1]